MTSNNTILKISNARKNILEILEIYQGYDVSAYKNFSINEIDAMYTNEQLDMLVKHKNGDKKTYVKFYVNKTLRNNVLDNMVASLFDEEELTDTDNLIVIVLDEPNESLCTHLNHLFKKKGIFVVVHNIKRLQYNILQHDLVPEMNIINLSDKEELKKRYNLTSLAQLPEIGRFDPQALAMSMRPGDVGEFKRKSVTTLENNYYRICV